MKNNPFFDLFGLDISDSDIRLARLRKQGHKIHISSLNEAHLPEGTVFDGEIKNEANLKNSILTLVKNAAGKKINTPYVNCVLPERKTFIKLIKLPQTDNQNINEAIKWEAAQHIPMNLEEMYLDWQIINTTDGGDKSLKVLIAAAPKNIVESYTLMLESAKLTPVSFETESLAIARSVFFEDDISQSAALIVDLGADHTNLIVYDRQSIQFSTTLSFSGKILTDKIAKELHLNFSDAEKAKIICGLEQKKGKGQIKKIIEPELNLLLTKITEAQVFYSRLFPECSAFKKIVLTGSGALLKNLDEYMAKKLNNEIIKADPLLRFDAKKSKVKLTSSQACSFSTAIGLALKNLSIK